LIHKLGVELSGKLFAQNPVVFFAGKRKEKHIIYKDNLTQ